MSHLVRQLVYKVSFNENQASFHLCWVKTLMKCLKSCNIYWCIFYRSKTIWKSHWKMARSLIEPSGLPCESFNCVLWLKDEKLKDILRTQKLTIKMSHLNMLRSLKIYLNTTRFSAVINFYHLEGHHLVCLTG